MEIITLTLEPGREYHITPYSDLHLDALASANTLVDSHMRARARLANPLFFGLGDIGNWIIPSDKHDPRATATTSRPELAQSDEYIDRCMDWLTETLSPYPWATFGMGNHERTMLKHHTNVSKRLAKRLGARYTGYSALVNLRFGRKQNLKVLQHHGAWGGGTNEIPPAAMRYASGFPDWRLFLYGHNHGCGVRAYPALRDECGRLVSQNRYAVCCGTGLRGMRQGGNPEYSEVAGYPPVPLITPLITVRADSDGITCQVTIGD